MYAIVEIAGQQFKVAKDQKLFVHRLQDKEGSKVSFDKVYLLDDGKKVTVGAPAISGAAVEAKVVGHLKGDKVIVFKKKRRKGYRVKNGHRQALTELMVEKIVASGAKPAAAKPKAKKAPAKVEDKPKAAKAAPAKKAPAKVEDKPKAVKAALAKKAPEKEAKVDYSKMTVAELKAIAKDKGISGYTSFKKAELISALNQ
jgi:large subunit ribosomal protein L21